jgi:hypothetical protein
MALCLAATIRPPYTIVKEYRLTFNPISICFAVLALEKEREKETKDSKRHTMSHPVDYIPDLDSPHQSRSPLKKDKKERVSFVVHFMDSLTASIIKYKIIY